MLNIYKMVTSPTRAWIKVTDEEGITLNTATITPAGTLDYFYKGRDSKRKVIFTGTTGGCGGITKVINNVIKRLFKGQPYQVFSSKSKEVAIV